MDGGSSYQIPVSRTDDQHEDLNIDIPPARRARLSKYVEGYKLLPWKWVDFRMDTAKNYWITTHASGYPSSRPVWGIWKSPVFTFSTGSLIASNIKVDPKVQLNLESGAELVIIEGVATPLEQSDVEFWVEAYKKKYSWDMPSQTEGVWQVIPKRVLAWISDSSGLDDGASFSNSATEWKFDAVY